jgi:hypothetical protein
MRRLNESIDNLSIEVADILKPCLRWVNFGAIKKVIIRDIEGLEKGDISARDEAETIIDEIVPEEKMTDVFDQYYEDLVHAFEDGVETDWYNEAFN